MRHWTRVEIATLCGSCPTVIKIGDPVLVITIHAGWAHVDRPKYRCPQCAGESVPDLPPYVERAPIVPRMLPLKNVAQSFDYKVRQAGEDDAA